MVRASVRRRDVKAALRSGSDPNERDANGDTALMVACQLGAGGVVRTLVKAGADVNARNLQGNSALHYCFGFGQLDIADFLVSKGADDAAENARGLTCYDVHGVLA